MPTLRDCWLNGVGEPFAGGKSRVAFAMERGPVMDRRPGGDVESWRGIDPGWWETGGLSYCTLLARAPCDDVVRVLREIRGVPDRFGDLLAGDDGPFGPVRYGWLSVYQLRGHPWTQVGDWGEAVTEEMAEALSRRLNTLAFLYDWEDVASGLSFEL